MPVVCSIFLTTDRFLYSRFPPVSCKYFIYFFLLLFGFLKIILNEATSLLVLPVPQGHLLTRPKVIGMGGFRYPRRGNVLRWGVRWDLWWVLRWDRWWVRVDLYLWKWTGSRWATVASSLSSSSSESISYNGSSGYYVWRIYSYSGSGSYDFWLDRP